MLVASLGLEVACAAKETKVSNVAAATPSTTNAAVLDTATVQTPVKAEEPKSVSEKPAPLLTSGPLTPTQIIEKYTQELKGVVEIKDPTKKGQKDESRENVIAEKVRKLFDFNELAIQSLGKQNIKKFKPYLTQFHILKSFSEK